MASCRGRQNAALRCDLLGAALLCSLSMMHGVSLGCHAHVTIASVIMCVMLPSRCLHTSLLKSCLCTAQSCVCILHVAGIVSVC